MTSRAPLLGVSACLFRGDSVLLVRRARAPFEGLLSLPGGKVRFGESLVDAVRREIREETALPVEDVAFLRFHEAIDAANGVHAVIAVFRTLRDLSPQAAWRTGDDAAEILLVKTAEIGALEAAARTTPGLAAVVDAAFRGR